MCGPHLFPEGLRQPLHELKAFRHVFVHAYDLELDPEKLALVLKYGRKRGEGPPSTCHTFRFRPETLKSHRPTSVGPDCWQQAL